MKVAIIGVPFALAVRDVVKAANLNAPDGTLGFLCPQCRQPVKPS